MGSILDTVAEQMAELQRYKDRFGPMDNDHHRHSHHRHHIYEVDDDDEGSDTEQE